MSQQVSKAVVKAARKQGFVTIDPFAQKNGLVGFEVRPGHPAIELGLASLPGRSSAVSQVTRNIKAVDYVAAISAVKAQFVELGYDELLCMDGGEIVMAHKSTNLRLAA